MTEPAFTLPDYGGGSLVNLMSSISTALGGGSPYPPLAALPPASLAGARHLVLLVVDGLGHDFLSGRDGALRRHLRGPLTSVFPSTTASAIPTFLTGLAPQQHGLTGWNMYFREIGAVVARCRSASAPAAMPCAMRGQLARLFSLTRCSTACRRPATW
jgi:hypothetical protein